jgi:hypothetical protein
MNTSFNKQTRMIDIDSLTVKTKNLKEVFLGLRIFCLHLLQKLDFDHPINEWGPWYTIRHFWLL